ncbi:MAG: imidazoleglycerol-phosphate dehydratase HisB [Dehalococcoidia bacterium]|nr:imidazoleglycerol-phosphate dehydratase HisB [Dehalococcoidia bacterium]
MAERKAMVTRRTKETSVKVEVNIDGSSQYDITTGIRFFDHMLCQLAQHGIFDLKISATGSDQHHVVEDVAITLGRAFNQALGDKHGIVRMADATIPMDDALALVSLDISGRGQSVIEDGLKEAYISEMHSDLISHFFMSFAAEARINIHAQVLKGNNDHHKAEALFKALARALDTATRLDPRISGTVPSTKDSLD